MEKVVVLCYNIQKFYGEFNMNREIANALSRYFRILYKINQNLLILCGDDIFYRDWDREGAILDMTQDIAKIVPIKFKSEILILEKQDGLLEFKKDLPFLMSDYEGVFSNNYELLVTIKKIRNKCEHKMHRAFSTSSCSSSWDAEHLFEVEHHGKIEEVGVSVKDLVNLIKDLNTLFSKLQEEVITYAKNDGLTDHPYYAKLRRFSFDDFNKIYESEVLQVVGRVMIDF